jgi:hypothetical protein
MLAVKLAEGQHPPIQNNSNPGRTCTIVALSKRCLIASSTSLLLLLLLLPPPASCFTAPAAPFSGMLTDRWCCSSCCSCGVCWRCRHCCCCC